MDVSALWVYIFEWMFQLCVCIQIGMDVSGVCVCTDWNGCIGCVCMQVGLNVLGGCVSVQI